MESKDKNYAEISKASQTRRRDATRRAPVLRNDRVSVGIASFTAGRQQAICYTKRRDLLTKSRYVLNSLDYP